MYKISFYTFFYIFRLFTITIDVFECTYVAQNIFLMQYINLPSGVFHKVRKKVCFNEADREHYQINDI